MTAQRPPEPLDVAIIGAGPAGLLLGLLLAARGLTFTLLDREPARRRHSRAIGVHAPALECLAALGLAEAFTARGVQVREGFAFGPSGYLGTVSFGSVSPAYPFVLTLPQNVTEELLEEALLQAEPTVLRRGARCVGLRDLGHGCEVTYLDGKGRRATVHARFVVGADGVRSFTRQAARIPARQVTYPDHYLMGDFDDTTAFGSAAAIFLAREGVVESFPLPGGLRRWVVKTTGRLEADRPEVLTRLIAARVGHHVAVDSCRMLSAFTTEYLLAERFTRGRVILLGDAAHVLSPLGGQGMNLAWLDAVALSEALGAVLGGREQAQVFRSFDRRRGLAWSAARLAELNMALGRASRQTVFRDQVLGALLNSPAAPHLARLYAMRWASPSPGCLPPPSQTS